MIFSETDLGLMPTDDKLPLIFLRERRRELVLTLQETPGHITSQQIHEIAAVHQAIKAVEAVLAE
jgi:hypothetical protein